MKKEMNNKGFSLVELIIVVAIMVVLIAVLAPQYLKYVEKSRVASDQTTIVGYIDAMQVMAADPDINLDSSKSYTLTSPAAGTTGNDKVNVSSDLEAVFVAEGTLDATAAKGATLQSTAYKDAAINIVLHYDTSKKVWQVVEGTTPASGVDVSGKVKPTPASP